MAHIQEVLHRQLGPCDVIRGNINAVGGALVGGMSINTAGI